MHIPHLEGTLYWSCIGGGLGPCTQNARRYRRHLHLWRAAPIGPSLHERLRFLGIATLVAPQFTDTLLKLFRRLFHVACALPAHALAMLTTLVELSTKTITLDTFQWFMIIICCNESMFSPQIWLKTAPGQPTRDCCS